MGIMMPQESPMLDSFNVSYAQYEGNPIRIFQQKKGTAVDACNASLLVVRSTGLEPVCSRIRPSNVRVCQFHHDRVCTVVENEGNPLCATVSGVFPTARLIIQAMAGGVKTWIGGFENPPVARRFHFDDTLIIPLIAPSCDVSKHAIRYCSHANLTKDRPCSRC